MDAEYVGTYDESRTISVDQNSNHCTDNKLGMDNGYIDSYNKSSTVQFNPDTDYVDPIGVTLLSESNLENTSIDSNGKPLAVPFDLDKPVPRKSSAIIDSNRDGGFGNNVSDKFDIKCASERPAVNLRPLPDIPTTSYRNVRKRVVVCVICAVIIIGAAAVILWHQLFFQNSQSVDENSEVSKYNIRIHK